MTFNLDAYLREVREAEDRANKGCAQQEGPEPAPAPSTAVPGSAPEVEASVPPSPAPEPPVLAVQPEAPAHTLAEPELGDDARCGPTASVATLGGADGAVESVLPMALPAPDVALTSRPEPVAVEPTAPVTPLTPAPGRSVTEQASLEPESPTPRQVRPTPGNWVCRDVETGQLTARHMYPNLSSWLEENTLSYDTMVSIAVAPAMEKEMPERLANALPQAAFAMGQNQPFVIKLPAASNAVLLGHDGTDAPPYGLQDLIPTLYNIYRDIRSAFILYQARFPTRVSLQSGEHVEGLGEVLMWKLKDSLLAAKTGMPELMKNIEVADVLAAALESALREVFSGLAPRDEVGRALQDPARMAHARLAWAEFLALISGK